MVLTSGGRGLGVGDPAFGNWPHLLGADDASFWEVLSRDNTAFCFFEADVDQIPDTGN